MVHNVLKHIQCTYTGGTVYVCTAVQEQSHHVGPTPFTCHMKWSNRILKYKLYHITLVLASVSFIHKHMHIYFFTFLTISYKRLNVNSTEKQQ